MQAADGTADSSLKFEILVEASEAAAYAGELEVVQTASRIQTQIPPVSDRDRFLLASGQGWVAVWAGDHAAAEVLFADALRRATALDDPRTLLWAADAALAAIGFGAGLPYANRAVEIARERGLLSLLPMALHRQALGLQWNSLFDRSYAAAREGYQLALEVGYGIGAHLASMAFVEAVWGHAEEARAHAQEALAIGQRSGSNLLSDTAELTIGFATLAAGDLEAAFDRLSALTAAARPRGHRLISLTAVPDFCEVATRIGREHDATEPLERYAAWVSGSRSEPGRALLARCRALVEEGDAETAFGEANQRADALSPFERARTRLLYGEWLRRQRRRADARPHLRAALESFRSLGTVPWEERAAAELRATGETTRKRDVSTLDQLTPQELQIAELVADGLTGREIAARLFLSPRTIDYHLRKVFSKLGIASRTELMRGGVPVRAPG
jgi:ATP/maltotriose-dependent transcriptional regulator MalT